MATVKSYTDLSQSKKLAEILPLENADMCWQKIYDENYLLSDYRIVLLPFRLYSGIGFPCWSLAALFSTLPILGENKDINPFIVKTPYNEYYVVYATLYKEIYSSDIYDNPIDACVDMIEYLYK